ncbi:MAG: Re/Si-specific NAD(P)(+) transhydrogenase subunit alpha [Gemmatimonadota bacterium]|nr:Re/Si-specific NAD(P)(+) transhydrogenase subunit alpha [Gemmatimonadota bacterium]
MAVTVGVPRESAPGERRVALTPDVAARLIRDGAEVRVETGAGSGAFFPDDTYREAGADIVSADEVHAAEVVARVAAPSAEERARLGPASTVIAFLRPLDDPRGVRELAATGATALSMELVPRITRAQKMDALSAMATVAGYRAVLLAAEALPKFFPLLTTAAGTVRPAKVLVLGAGVAGLQALATARRLGAVVSAYDVRAAAREQVESVGARFVELELPTADAEGAGGYARALDEERQRRQTELLVPHVGEADVVITTALIPGRPAPLLITEAAVRAMAPGSVILDIAAPNGGNCALTRPGEMTEAGGVRIFGPLNLAAEMPLHASQMYARTVAATIAEFTRDGAFRPDPDDEIFRDVCVARGGEVVHPRVRSLLDPIP